MLWMSSGELLAIVSISAVLIGPSGLPKLARNVGYGVGSAVRLMWQGRQVYDELARTTELRQVRFVVFFS